MFLLLRAVLILIRLIHRRPEDAVIDAERIAAAGILTVAVFEEVPILHEAQVGIVLVRVLFDAVHCRFVDLLI